MSADDATAEQAREALIAAIAAQAERAPNASTLLRLAEAYAWVVQPGQAHGGGGDN
ncbi:MAG: hypothetical protein AB7V42_09210 [Thermoleophilia bacterium]